MNAMSLYNRGSRTLESKQTIPAAFSIFDDRATADTPVT